jgi:hypothetical protein
MSEQEVKKDRCEQCLTKGILTKKDACAESACGYGRCCWKYVCKTDCVYSCSFCKNKGEDSRNFTVKEETLIKILLDLYATNGVPDLVKLELRKNGVAPDLDDTFRQFLYPKKVKVIYCKDCFRYYYPYEVMSSPFIWWGISIQEWLDKYD